MHFRAHTLSSAGLALLLLGTIAEAKTIKIATVVPEGSSWLVEMRKAGEEITEKPLGRVKLKFYPGGVMGNQKTVLRKMRAGQLHGGAFTSGALAKSVLVEGLPDPAQPLVALLAALVVGFFSVRLDEIFFAMITSAIVSPTSRRWIEYGMD